MKGSVTQYNVSGTSRKKWRYRIYIGRDQSGRKLYEGRGGFERERDASAAMRTHLVAMEASAAGRTTHTLGSWVTHWIDTYAILRCKSRVTVERYRRLAKYLESGPSEKLRRIAGRPLSLVTHIDLEPAILSMVNAKGIRRKISARTVRHLANLINVALKKAVTLDHIPVNPMEKVDLPAVPRRHIRSLTPEEIQKLRAVCDGDWTFTLVELALATGCRRGELLALMWRDVDFTRKTVLVSKSLEQTKEGLRLKPDKSERPRICSLPNVAVEALQKLRAKHIEWGRNMNRAFIFCEPTGDFLRPDLVSQIVKRRLRKAGIPDASLHTLRHSHASVLLSNGVPLPAVSARLGHADPQVTARIYSHALPGDDLRAAQAWDFAMSEGVTDEAGERAESDPEQS